MNVGYADRLGFECIKCGRPLKCVLNHTSPHFKHKSKYVFNCNPTPESLLHKTAKEIILLSNYINLPVNNEVYYFDEAIPEQKIENQRRPDVILKQGVHILLVEIVVSNRLTAPKIEDYKLLGQRCLIIDLTNYARLFDIEELTDDIIVSIARKSFLHFHETEVIVDSVLSEKSKNDDGGLSGLFWIAAAGAVAYLFNMLFPNFFKIPKKNRKLRRKGRY